MDATATGSDRGVGLGVGLGLLAVVGALVTFLNPDSAVAGWGFALAMAASALSVVAVQLA